MRDEKGEKMSKSKGNTANPLDVVRDYSADALRFTIITGSAPGADMRLFREKLENARNFANKIWNMGRFVVSGLQGFSVNNSNFETVKPETLSTPDRWILSRLHRTIAYVTKAYGNWQFGEGTRAVYEFLWDEFADWYIEASKIALNSGDADARRRTLAVLIHTLDQALRLLHPAMPFVTEEVWQNLKRAVEGESTGDFVGPAPSSPHWAEALMIAPWPQSDKKRINARAEKEFGALMDAIRAIRNARTEFKVEAGKKIPAIISAGNARRLYESQRDALALLAHLDPDALTIEKTAARPARALALVASNAEIFLPFEGMFDVAKEQARLKNEMERTRADVTRQENLLAGEFSKRAPKEVVQKTRDQLAANVERLGKLDALIASLEGRASVKRTKGTKSAKAKKVRRKR
jgi:valyl-tRNA synthetase